MNAIELAALARRLGLALVGAINRAGGSIRFELNDCCFVTDGCVYTWIGQMGDNYAVVYVGIYPIYARQSETVTLFGLEGLPMAPVEELALQRLLNPRWNRTTFRIPYGG